ncbi:RNA-directed DNA polymerase from mobile element jockey [Elysia marginata]|uniref:RNA-directed DNA polymerase from mobile element jockey n=1 Tax=Elysia marginata TaxID=1093978 RepID=A0AAV4JBI4_9GAST|nr:RNA-directed DNA polymerase from mobile element jockey [Elysia marginata]
MEYQTVKLLLLAGGMYITNIYSPPSTPLSLKSTNNHNTRHLIVGDFNSHSPSWEFASMDSRGGNLEDWMTENQLILINKPDDTPTFFSRSSKSLSTPDLAMATDDVHSLTERRSSTAVTKTGRQINVFLDFLLLQHRTTRVYLDGHISHRIRLQQGVPQVGVISTTLFLVFINDIHDGISRHISRALHADDLAIWNAEKNLPTATYRMQEALNTVAARALNWGVVINETKEQLVDLHFPFIHLARAN